MSKNNPSQMNFDLFAEAAQEYGKRATKSSKQTVAEQFGKRSLQQAVLGWLLKQNPQGIGVRVMTRLSRFQADVAAFWSTPQRRLLQPGKTVIVEMRDNREQCWADCADREKLLKELRHQKVIKEELEAKIRLQEPQLKELDNLFDEFQSWDYAASSNVTYQKCLNKIKKLHHALYKGSKFEQIRSSHVANELYLAVPDGEVHADELADGWGLLHVNPKTMAVTEIKKPELEDSPLPNRLHLIQNIAAACAKSVAFENGIVENNGEVFFVKRPHRRRRISL